MTDLPPLRGFNLTILQPKGASEHPGMALQYGVSGLVLVGILHPTRRDLVPLPATLRLREVSAAEHPPCALDLHHHRGGRILGSVVPVGVEDHPLPTMHGAARPRPRPWYVRSDAWTSASGSYVTSHDQRLTELLGTYGLSGPQPLHDLLER